MKITERIKRFFFPPPGSPRWKFVLSLGVVVLFGGAFLAGGTYAWDYTNSPAFCGDTCHTMPPQDLTYKISPHANVYCTECHIGRAFVGEQFARKSEDIRELYATVFNTYEFPIRATRSRPARETCEKCHLPETFTSDTLRTITHYANDVNNSAQSIYLILKTGGGSKEQGLGRGIHWHIVNKVEYYAADATSQVIPFVRVYNDDGSVTEYVDVQSGFDPAKVDEAALKEIDCITCHNRVTHNFQTPEAAVDEAMSRGLIDAALPGIRRKAVEALRASYLTREEAIQSFEALGQSYTYDVAAQAMETQIKQAVKTIAEIYDLSVFPVQKVDWTTHPNNLGHMAFPGCFRCHDGKHLNAEDEAIRLECNLCHSIPVVADEQDFIASIEISRGLEPESHRNPNWISLHNQAFDDTCANCHTMDDPGGTSNTSFCSNSACHGSVYTYAGFDAPELRQVLQAQLPPPTPTPTPAPVVNVPTFDANISPLFQAKCTKCHGAAASAGLSFLTFAETLAGSSDGAVIVAGDSANSKLVQVQSGKHFGKFSEEELALIIEWIDAGALEK